MEILSNVKVMKRTYPNLYKYNKSKKVQVTKRKSKFAPVSSQSPTVYYIDKADSKLVYNLLSVQVMALSTIPTTIMYFPWLYNQAYSNGMLIFKTEISNTDLIIQVIDDDDNIIGNPMIVNYSGIITFKFTMPKKNTNIIIQISKYAKNTITTSLSNNPSIFGMNLELK